MISRVLFLTESREDYLADSLLHGLITLGLEVVDYPRKQVLYAGSQSCSAAPHLGVRGHGFTLYGLIPDRAVDRSFVIQRLESAWFDLVVIGQVWRQWGQLLDLAPFLQKVPVVLLDGDDDTRLFHLSGTRVRRYGWQPFPIRSGRCLYLKREWHGDSRHGRWCRVIPASFSIPEVKIQRPDIKIKSQQIASHCVDAEVANACRLHTSYAFASEKEYYSDISRSFFAITTKRGGWDCLRHYEIAAAGSVLCFKNLEFKNANCAPHGLEPGVNCLSYSSWQDLEQQLHVLEEDLDRYSLMLSNSTHWIASNSTKQAALRLLEHVERL